MKLVLLLTPRLVTTLRVVAHWIAAPRPRSQVFAAPKVLRFVAAERPYSAFPPGTMYSWSAWEREYTGGTR
jgi:hypothetical protein